MARVKNGDEMKPRHTQIGLRTPDADREAIARVQRELSEKNGLDLSQNDVVLHLLRLGLRSYPAT
jgi:hypothetical protein